MHKSWHEMNRAAICGPYSVRAGAPGDAPRKAERDYTVIQDAYRGNIGGEDKLDRSALLIFHLYNSRLPDLDGFAYPYGQCEH